MILTVGVYPIRGDFNGLLAAYSKSQVFVDSISLQIAHLIKQGAITESMKARGEKQIEGDPFDF